MKKFNSMEEYEAWTEQFEDASEYGKFPVCIDNGKKVMCDMFVECKRISTALRRFLKTFKDVNEEISDWVEGMKESCENGYLKDSADFYSWGVEWCGDDRYYIYLNFNYSR